MAPVKKHDSEGETPRSSYRFTSRVRELIEEMAHEDDKNMTAWLEDLVRTEAKRRKKPIQKDAPQ